MHVPTNEPTDIPSSSQPSFTPTLEPSVKPTYMPSMFPTNDPTNCPLRFPPSNQTDSDNTTTHDRIGTLIDKKHSLPRLKSKIKGKN